MRHSTRHGLVGGDGEFEPLARQVGTEELQRDRRAAARAERIDAVQPRARRDRQPIDVVLQTLEADVLNANRVLTVGRRSEAHERVGTERVRVLGDDSATGIVYFQPRVQSRSNSRRVDFTRDDLSGLRFERPVIDVLARKDPAVDRYRQREQLCVRLAF